MPMSADDCHLDDLSCNNNASQPCSGSTDVCSNALPYACGVRGIIVAVHRKMVMIHVYNYTCVV